MPRPEGSSASHGTCPSVWLLRGACIARRPERSHTPAGFDQVPAVPSAGRYRHRVATLTPAWLAVAGAVALLCAVGVALATRAAVRQRRLAAAREAQARELEEMIGASSDLILVTDPAGVVTYASAASDRILGRSPDELTENLLSELVEPTEVPAVLEALDRVDRTADVELTLELAVQHTGGGQRLLECRVRALGDRQSGGRPGVERQGRHGAKGTGAGAGPPRLPRLPHRRPQPPAAARTAEPLPGAGRAPRLPGRDHRDRVRRPGRGSRRTRAHGGRRGGRERRQAAPGRRRPRGHRGPARRRRVRRTA